MKLALTTSLLALALAQATQAAEVPSTANIVADDTDWGAGLITVTASRLGTLDIGGSVTVLDAQALDRFSYGDVNRILRQVPGVFLQEEDGFGLRPNIGIRGSGTDRSARVAIMEDGVLISPAPYAAPAAYYFPRLARIQGVEVAKGPAAIKYGPSTVGGAINFFSTPLPDGPAGEISGRVDLLAGNYGSQRALGSVGGWAGLGGGLEVGGLIEGLYEHSDGFKTIDAGGETGFKISDMVAKLGLRSTDGAHALTFKYQRYTERSDETYLGLTLADFRTSPNRRYNASAADVMNVSHETFQLTHDWKISDRVRVTTIAYRNDTARSWYKLNDIRNTANTGWTSIAGVLENPAAAPIQFAELVGAEGFTGRAGSLRVRDNNRIYQSTGAQTALSAGFDTGSIAHTLEVSARYHEDSEDRFQQDDRFQMVNGRLVLTTPGAPGSQDNRRGDAKAWAFYVQDTIEAGPLTLVPGLRYETIDLTQTRWALGDAVRATPTAINTSKVDVWIPGLAATLRLADDVRLIAGAHRGFASPAPGSTVAAETSWNYEAGVRFGTEAWRAEVIGFFNDYSNLVGTCTASSGGDCNIGDQFAGGAVEVKGIEATASTVLGNVATQGFEVPVSLVYTYTDARFQTAFASSYAPWGTVAIGDRLPYIPEHQIAVNAGLQLDRLRFDTTLNYVSKARATAGQGGITGLDLIDDRILVDLSAGFDLRPGVSLFGTVSNVFNVAYNASFSPDGARPGAPRMAMGGVKLRF
ncbi:Fe(3+) dicitrate transport protein [Polymorphobacter multimanifer]|uniref:Fe(3+) dicitrate transport protein n=3 Tax=Polymorphobacter multimanifer TaxID=1070431 RepID=A0A841L5P3_9SPHN|nr:TonB-dependent receptor [Polymorphobacter multimanifer]MBB6226811.1 Fe(3+) dicitrate transport protein [Polymorphobacter multimanifer]